MIAACLKVVGIFVAMLTAWVNSGDWAINRWWGGLVTGFLLIALLLPWHKRFANPRAIHVQMIAALIFAIVGHQFDLIQSSYANFDLLAANERFQLLIGWNKFDVNNVHALGSLFVIVPVVLASWQYGFVGMFGSLGLAGALYVGAPLWLPSDTFNWWFYAVRGFVLLGVTLILATIVTNLGQEQRRKQAQLAAANAKLSEQAIVMEQLATSRERNRLARELHDTLAHTLSGTAVQLGAVEMLLQHDVKAASAEIASAKSQVRKGLHEARRAINALRATPLEELGLTEALRQHVQAVTERNGWTLQRNIETLPTLAPHVEQTIYRIVEEALSNIERHAGASSVWISAENTAQSLTFTIRDNGIGFDPTTQHADRFGLVGMNERAALIAGVLTVTSKRERGTTIQLTVPISPLSVEHLNG